MRVAIVNYGTCNIRSIIRRLNAEGLWAMETIDPKDLEHSDKIILPGIGHFGHAMQMLRRMNLIDALNEQVLVKKKPILGICLGMQLMTDSSEEGNGASGLGWLRGTVRRMATSDTNRYKIPHIGWNQLQHLKSSPLFRGIEPEAAFYYTHSYHCETMAENVVATTTYGGSFTAAIGQDHIFGVQFHPEKSYEPGTMLLKNFLAL